MLMIHSALKSIMMLAGLLLISCKEDQGESESATMVPLEEQAITSVSGIEDGLGFVKITAVGAESMASLSFKWSNGVTGPELRGVAPGRYSVTISNGRGFMHQDFDLAHPVDSESKSAPVPPAESAGDEDHFQWFSPRGSARFEY